MSQASDTPYNNGMLPYVELAGEALLRVWTRQLVIAVLISQIRRDGGYLAYRQATGRNRGYDEQVKAAMRALAPAAVLFEEERQPILASCLGGQHRLLGEGRGGSPKEYSADAEQAEANDQGKQPQVEVTTREEKEPAKDYDAHRAEDNDHVSDGEANAAQRQRYAELRWRLDTSPALSGRGI